MNTFEFVGISTRGSIILIAFGLMTKVIESNAMSWGFLIFFGVIGFFRWSTGAGNEKN